MIISIRALIVLSVFVAVIMLSGCSSGQRENPVIMNNPQTGVNLSNLPDIQPDDANTDHSLIGAWTLQFDPQNLTLEASLKRDLKAHWNVKTFLPPPAFTVVNYDPISCILDALVVINNPSPFSGYDVRLIVYTDNLGVRLTNADDWTGYFDIPGGAQINPFKAYAKNETNREFKGSGTNQEQWLQLYFPPGSTMLDFAIDASFPSNCSEPYEIKNFTQADLWNIAGCKSLVQVDVFDWQDDVNAVNLWCPTITGQTMTPFTHWIAQKWQMDLYNNTGADPGKYVACVIATSSNSGSVALYDVVEITVKKAPVIEGDVISWGGNDYDSGNALAIDSSGNIYVTGEFIGLVDFDPGPLPVERTSNGLEDIFLVKFDRHWNLLWVLTWGGDRTDLAYDVEIDNSGFVYVTGAFSNVVDFDPGPGVDEHRTSVPDDKNIYLTKMDSDGDFIWARTWGGQGANQEGYDLAIDQSSNIYVTGRYRGTADFDPGNGQDIHISTNTTYDSFLSGFNPDGNFLWARTWGGNNAEYGYGIAINGNNIYVTGSFKSTVDFNPGTGTDNRSSNNNSYDIYLAKYDSTGNYAWVRIWGSNSDDEGLRLVADNNGNIFITGYFVNTADFDPGSGTDPHTSNGAQDVFLSKFDTDGNYIWGRHWGGNEPYGDFSFGMNCDDNQNIYVTGRFRGTADFDPTLEVDQRISAGGSDLFLSKFNNDGNYIWAMTRGGIDAERGYDVDFYSNEIYLCGYFAATCDFNPGSGVDVRTSNGYLDAFLYRFIP